jgi:arsenate reductase
MSDKPTVLFVCVHNAGRSQMAAGWLRHLAGDRVEIRSAGSEPAHQINPAAVQAMHEVGIDITGQTPTKLTWETAEASDVIGQGVDAVRPIRDEIRHRVEQLVAGLGPAT